MNLAFNVANALILIPRCSDVDYYLLAVQWLHIAENRERIIVRVPSSCRVNIKLKLDVVCINFVCVQ